MNRTNARSLKRLWMSFYTAGVVFLLSGLLLNLVVLPVQAEWDGSELYFSNSCSGNCQVIQATICNSGAAMQGTTTFQVLWKDRGSARTGTVVYNGIVPALPSGVCATLSFNPLSVSNPPVGYPLGNFIFRAQQRPEYEGDNPVVFSVQCRPFKDADECRLPTPTNTPETPTATFTFTPTNTPETPTATFTFTPTNTPETPTVTFTFTPTNTPVTPTPQDTEEPTPTPVTPTPQDTEEPTPTPVTPTPQDTEEPTPTPVTPTPQDTEEPTPTPVTPTPQDTEEPTPTPVTPTPQDTEEPTPTPVTPVPEETIQPTETSVVRTPVDTPPPGDTTTPAPTDQPPAPPTLPPPPPPPSTNVLIAVTGGELIPGWQVLLRTLFIYLGLLMLGAGMVVQGAGRWMR